MIIKKADIVYLEEIAKIEEKVFAHPWSADSIKNLLKDDKSAVFVALKENKVTGYCGVNTVLDEGYITNIAVLEEYRRKGIGEALVKAFCGYAEKTGLAFLTLEVRKSNLPAIKLYEKNGFKKVGERKDYYSSPKENALLMTKFFE